MKNNALVYVSLVVMSLLIWGTWNSVLAQGLDLSGKWATNLGVIRIAQTGKKVEGKLIWVSKSCPFKKGDVVLNGFLLEDSLSGKYQYCLKGKECQDTKWAPLVMLVARGGKVLSGAAHFKPTECNIGGKGKGKGLVVRKLKIRPKKKVVPKEKVVAEAKKDPPSIWDKMVDEQGNQMEEEVKPLNPDDYVSNSESWQKVMEEGAGWMQSGMFERARRNFKKATKLDPTRPEAFNGIGVTYYARNDYEEALRWYKKALEVSPNFGDAYYNMACIYSLMKKKSLALRYLNIAALNGFVEIQAISQDPDLKNLRDDQGYKDIIKKIKNKL
jgi:hypothetical protein